MYTAILWTFLAYFVILFAERTQSIVRILASGESLFSTRFDGYVNILTVVSLTATAFLLITSNRGFWHALFSGDTTGFGTANITMLCLTAGVLLLSGMVHTEYTIPVMQFVAYGVLIAGLALQTVLSVQAGGNAFNLWYSLVYVVAFSMAIPVMYKSSISQAVLFHILEAITAAALVVMFTFLLLKIMKGEGADLLLWVPFVTMLVLDAVLIVMRWKEKVNTFVLIFASLSTVLFVVGKILFAVLKNRK